MKNVIIDGFNYIIKPFKFDLTKLDTEGICDEYCGKCFVFTDEDTGKLIVREVNHFTDDNNNYYTFDPYNYNEDQVYVILSHGDDSWNLYDVFEILWTDNVTGLIKTECCHEILPDLISKSKNILK